MDSIGLKDLWSWLSEIPPTWENWEARRTLLSQVDDTFSETESENNPVLSAFYDEICRKTIAEIRAWHGPGVRLWKLYSSAVLIKSTDGVVTGFDLNDGCTPETRRTRFRISPELAESFAEVIDRMFYTHGHLDHLGLLVADAMLRKGKLVVAPHDALRYWLLDGAISSEELDLKGVRCWQALQRMSPGRDIPNTAYAVNFQPGLTVLVRGDIYRWEDLEPIYNQIEREGLKIDVMATSPFYQSGSDPIPEAHRRFGCSFIPIHEWEFSHRKFGESGKATQTYTELYGFFEKFGKEGACQVLTWGESTMLSH